MSETAQDLLFACSRERTPTTLELLQRLAMNLIAPGVEPESTWG